MKEIIENKTFDMERTLYNSDGLLLKNCRFDGPADGESALKESRNVELENCFFNLRYPFWHDDSVKITDAEMTEMCRAAIWYSRNMEIAHSKLHGIKALRECANIKMRGCDVISPEFGCYCKGLKLMDCEMVDTDLSFEKSQVEATLTAPIVSIKNPLSGHIYVPCVDEIIRDDNVDRERVLEEVLVPFKEGRPVVYRPYDAHRPAMLEPVRLAPAPITIIEGSYSCHPALWDYYDVRVFLDVGPEEQLQRIEARSGPEKLEVFKSRWIPLEDAYFEAFSLEEKCDFCFVFQERST